MEEWLDYCEYCGSTAEPRLVVKGKVTLEGTVPGDEREETKRLKLKDEEQEWVCSDCGALINKKGDEP